MMSFLPFFPSYLEELGVEGRDALAAWTGVIFGAAPLAAAFMGPIWGSIGDRFSRKLMVVRALLAIMLFVGLMAFVRTPWELLALRFCQGIFSGFVPPSIALVSVAAPVRLQGRVVGSLQGALAAGSIVGPLVGAFVQEISGLSVVFLGVCGASGLSALLVGLFAHEDPELIETVESWSPTSVLANTWNDVRDLFANTKLRSALVVLFCMQFGIGATNPLLELLVRDRWDGDPALVPRLTGLLFTLLALASLIAMPLWGRYGDRVGHARALVRCTFAGAVTLALHAAAPVFAALAGARVLLGLTSSGASAATFGIAATETAVERRGGAMAVAFSSRALAMSTGAMTGGALAAFLGIQGLFLAGSGVVFVCLALTRPVRRSRR